MSWLLPQRSLVTLINRNTKRINWWFEQSLSTQRTTQIAKFMGPIWGPPGSCRPQMGPMLAPWALLSGQHTRASQQKCTRFVLCCLLLWFVRLYPVSLRLLLWNQNNRNRNCLVYSTEIDGTFALLSSKLWWKDWYKFILVTRRLWYRDMCNNW